MCPYKKNVSRSAGNDILKATDQEITGMVRRCIPKVFMFMIKVFVSLIKGLYRTFDPSCAKIL